MLTIADNVAAGTLDGFNANSVGYFSIDVRATTWGQVEVEIRNSGDDDWHAFAPDGTAKVYTADACETYLYGGGVEFRFECTGGSGYTIYAGGGNLRKV